MPLSGCELNSIAPGTSRLEEATLCWQLLRFLHEALHFLEVLDRLEIPTHVSGFSCHEKLMP